MAQYGEVKAVFGQEDIEQQLRDINEGLEFEQHFSMEKEDVLEGEVKEETKEDGLVKDMDKPTSPRRSDIEIDYGKVFDEKYDLVDKRNPHFQHVKKMFLNKHECCEVKRKALREQQMLVEFYSSNVTEIEKCNKGIEKFFFQQHLHELLTENQEIFENLSKHLIFSEENKRFFDVSI